MFWRLWLRALTVKRPQAVLAISSLLVGSAIVSMLLNLYTDVRRQMTREFSAYGANVVLAPKDIGIPAAPATDPGRAASVRPLTINDALIDEDELHRLDRPEMQKQGLMVVPRLNIITQVQPVDAARMKSVSVSVVAVGTDFTALHQLNRGWRVDGDSDLSDGNACAIGTNLARRVGVGIGQKILLEAPGSAHNASQQPATPRTRHYGDRATYSPAASSAETSATRLDENIFTIGSIVSTGSAEDDQVFVPLAQLQDLSGLAATASGVTAQSAPSLGRGRKLSLVELYIPGDAQQIEGAIGKLRQVFGGSSIEVHPVRRILYSEARVLGTIRGLVLSLTGVILVIIALCVSATMSAIVLERRRDVALMKALGGNNHQVMLLFLAEGATLGFLAGLGGYVAGALLANELGRRLFGVNLHWAWWAGPVVCLATVLLALFATFLPVRSVRTVNPAVVLKGA
jgi:putative ABC transport system permease protein